MLIAVWRLVARSQYRPIASTLIAIIPATTSNVRIVVLITIPNIDGTVINLHFEIRAVDPGVVDDASVVVVAEVVAL